MTGKTHWERFQELHALIIRTGAIVDQIHLHPDSIQALTDEMFPIDRQGTPKSPIVAAVTNSGPVKIVSDKDGILL